MNEHTKTQKDLDIDINELVEDEDDRLLIASDYVKDRLLYFMSNQIKPHYVHYQKHIQNLEYLQTFCIIISFIFLILSRPEWCVVLGDQVNFMCTKSLNPDDPVEYYFWSPVVLDFKFKMTMCFLSQVIVLVSQLIKIKITQSSSYDRNIFIVGFFISLFYAVGIWLKAFDIYNIPLMDLIAFTFFACFIESIQKPILRVYNLLPKSYGVIMFLIYFGFIVGTVSRVFFGKEPDLYDSDDSFMFYNFTSYFKSLYSGLMIGLIGGGGIDLMLYYYGNNWFKFIYWFVIYLFFRFLLPNLFIIAFMKNYKETFKGSLEYILKFPKLTKILKYEIYNGTYTNAKAEEILQTIFTTDDYKTKIRHFEEFYRVSSDGDFNTVRSSNADSAMNIIQDFINSDTGYYVRSFLEGISVILILFAFEYQGESVKPFYIFIFLFQFVLMVLDFAFLMTQKMTLDDFWRVLNIAAGAAILTLIIFNLLNTNPLYFVSFNENNITYQKIIGFLILSKSIQFYLLIMKVDLPKTLIEGTIKNFSFISELFKGLFFVYFIYSIIGLYLYGGSVNSGTAQKYYDRFGDELAPNAQLFNQNDYPHSFYLLFMIMMIGWGDYQKLLTINREPSWWNNLYFLSFYFIIGIVMFNNLQGLIIDSTIAVLASEKKKK